MNKKASVLIAMTFLLAQCGQDPNNISETSAEKTWYGYCVNPTTAKFFYENGRTVQKFKCGKKNMIVQASLFSSAQSQAQTECKRQYGSSVRLGSKGNAGPGAAGGDVTTNVSDAFDWVRLNCYASIEP